MIGLAPSARAPRELQDGSGIALLVGDHHELPEVAAGGAFRGALDTLGDHVVELTINRRQHNIWEQHAVDELRCGDVATVFATYRDHGRVIIITDTRAPSPTVERFVERLRHLVDV